jgi:transcriptional regulator with XRE-family HTH domain
MANSDLEALGKQIAGLRIARQLKQTELAYEAGVSHRTLQRLEAGEAVKSDGLLKVIKCLGRLDSVLGALEATGFSPYEKLAEAGLKVSQLKKLRPADILAGKEPAVRQAPAHKRRVRRSRKAGADRPSDRAPNAEKTKTVAVQWPEDQR